MSEQFKRILNRFLRGGAAGALTTMIMIVPTNTSEWSSLVFWLEALVLSGVFGFISGGLLALDKYIRDSE